MSFSNLLSSATPWLLSHGLKILTIIIVSYLVFKFGEMVIDKIIRRAIPGSGFDSKTAEKKREDTLIRVLAGTMKAIVAIIAIIMILSEIGIDTAPFLAAAGIMGLAFGFGGQYLIRDLIAGLFIIIENQYRVGDTITLNDLSGSVEHISLRATVLRDMDGVVHFIPHGTISKVSNKTKGYAKINLNIGISYKSDIDKAIKIIDDLGDNMVKDKKWGEKIIVAPKFLRVDNLGNSSVELKIVGETKPGEQWAVTGELRKRLKEYFEKNKIEIPYPQVVIHSNKN